MKQVVNEVYGGLFKKPPRYVILMGGRGAGRSTVASQFALAKLVAPEYFRCAIMRYILGTIRNSIYLEVKDRIEQNGVSDAIDINDSLMTLKYGENSINAQGFKKSSADQTSKLKSLANYNCVIVEEADEISEEDFMQLDDSLRTTRGDIVIILLLNPPAKSHWIISRWFDLKESGMKGFYIPVLKKGLKDVLFVHSNYEDNRKNLSEQTLTNYEAYRWSKPAHYWGMVKGLVAEVVQGKVYSNWKKIPEVPHEARLVRYGLDFGYTNDPTAVVAIYKYNDGYIIDEVMYAKGMQNDRIAAVFENIDKALIIADSAEPKSIDDIARYELQILPAKKGADSIVNGIDIIKGLKISVTERSKNIWKEYDNYAWMQTKEGESINETKPGYDHAMDAMRYAFASLIEILPEKIVAQQANKMASVENRVRNGGGSTK